MLSTKLKEAAGNGADATLYVDDVFSTWLYTGNGSTQTITNGIDLAGKGGLVWGKRRNVDLSNLLFDTVRGNTKYLLSNTSGAEGTDSPATYLTSFNGNGFSVGAAAATNNLNDTYASWTFRKAAKFFDVQTVSHTNGTANTIDLSTLATVGMVIAKNTTTVGDWDVWHRSLTAGNNLQLNLTNAQSTTNAWLSVSGTTATLAASAPTGTYVIYAYAHDTSATGIIQCGSFTTDASGNVPTTALGWEPQYLLFKRINAVSSWTIIDSMRGVPTGGSSLELMAQGAYAESTGTGRVFSATGFSINGLGNPSDVWIYMAIRRPNKPPTSGTQVYNAIARTGTGAAATVTGVGFAPDTVMFADRLRNSSNFTMISDRLRGTTDGTSGSSRLLKTNDTGAELVDSSFLDNIRSLTMDGFNVGSDYLQYINKSGLAYINHAFKRAPGFFDVVCYTGTGANATIPHNLTVVPELMIVKSRSNATNWTVYVNALGNMSYLLLQGVNAAATGVHTWNDTTPTSSVFSLGTQLSVNGSGYTFVAYLFATLAGIQYINSYVGDGTTGRVINCGFSAGARFICIKATSTAGSWWVWDSARGITSTNDPALQLNSTAAEITSADAIDPSSSGFIVNQEATCSINASGVSYLVWAIA